MPDAGGSLRKERYLSAAFNLRRTFSIRIVYAFASNDEIRDHIETLHDTKLLIEAAVYLPSMCPHIDPTIAFGFNTT